VQAPDHHYKRIYLELKIVLYVKFIVADVSSLSLFKLVII